MSEHEAYERVLREIESSFQSATHEIAYVIDLDGTIAMQQEGGHDFVDLPADVLYGRTVIHNHPGGTSLSVEDVRTQIETGALEMRVVTATYRYSFRVPSEVEWEDVESLVRDVVTRIYHQLAVAVNTNEITGLDGGASQPPAPVAAAMAGPDAVGVADGSCRRDPWLRRSDRPPETAAGGGPRQPGGWAWSGAEGSGCGWPGSRRRPCRGASSGPHPGRSARPAPTAAPPPARRPTYP